MTRKLFLCFTFSALSALVFGVAVVFAEPAANTKEEIRALNEKINEHKEKIKQLEETISKYKQNIDQKQTEAVSLRNQLSILDNRTGQIQANIDVTKEKISEAQLEIEALNLSIKEKEQVIAKQKKLVSKMIKDIHANDQKNYLEIMLTNDNFADFYDQLQYLETVYIDLGRSVKNLRLAKEELDAKKQQVAERKKVYQQLKQDLDQKKQDLQEQIGAKQTLLAQTKSSELRYKTLLESLKQQYQIIESEQRSYEEEVRKKLAEQEKLPTIGNLILSWPVPSRYITTRFHDPEYPFRRVFEHNAIDIRASHGTPVLAAAAGYVARAKRCSTAACYSYVLIVHTSNISTVYGHLSQITVTDDQFVNRGEIIGYSGGTPGTVGAGPFVTGPHLHFEVRLNGIPVDPLGFLIQ